MHTHSTPSLIPLTHTLTHAESLHKHIHLHIHETHPSRQHKRYSETPHSPDTPASKVQMYPNISIPTSNIHTHTHTLRCPTPSPSHTCPDTFSHDTHMTSTSATTQASPPSLVPSRGQCHPARLCSTLCKPWVPGATCLRSPAAPTDNPHPHLPARLSCPPANTRCPT